ncbi:ABC transporter ATP-binding protein [Paramagnetospirillum magneticum]|uniref:ABC-type polysaccharide/polyol phosphate transport system n=1 Tax=Paramagnetospirillum magneticum (strain ATCC 700264 / AMB-1) TaxID=342108 RepID=Q2W8F1_PARM1|nr:ATP-binding cassette domain-containing protein [Paramagnetospirillum magneticum]BAE49874.1 ABC-type polysaccharide/polyol phosphate transport system [Paramagnetospirillum magneticum AMB-1]
MMARLELQDVTVTYRLYDAEGRSFTRSLLKGAGGSGAMTVSALDSMSLSIEAGSRIAVLGSNSSGKTTLLRVMAGLLPPKSGTILRDGKPGAVFGMGFGVDPEASLGDLALAQGLLMGLTLAEASAKVRHILEFSGVSDHGMSKARITPPGILARLGIASALCLDADIILLDEVLELVDPVFHQRVLDEMEQRLRRGAILIVVDRSRDLLSRFCSEALLLRDGRIAMRAPLAEAFHNSAVSQTF